MKHFPPTFVDCIEEMVLNMRVKDEISPTLRNIVNLFDEDNIRPSDYCSSAPKAAEQVHMDYDVDDRFDVDDFDNFGTANYDNDDQTSMVDDGPGGGDAGFPTYHEVIFSIIHTHAINLYSCYLYVGLD